MCGHLLLMKMSFCHLKKISNRILQMLPVIALDYLFILQLYQNSFKVNEFDRYFQCVIFIRPDGVHLNAL